MAVREEHKCAEVEILPSFFFFLTRCFKKLKNCPSLGDKRHKLCWRNSKSKNNNNMDKCMDLCVVSGGGGDEGLISTTNIAVQYAAASTPPNQQRWHAKTEAQSEHVHVAHKSFARFGADSHARSVIRDKNFCIGAQEEAHQGCVVGWACENFFFFFLKSRCTRELAFSSTLSTSVPQQACKHQIYHNFHI